MRFSIRLFVPFIFLLLHAVPLQSQVNKSLTLEEYLERVRVGNLEYAAERLEIDIADAQIISASVFENPSIEFSYYSNELRRMEMGEGVEVELSKTFSPGRRRAAINIAKSQKQCTIALLTDFYRELRREAALTWLEGVKLRQLCEIMRDSYKDQHTLIRRDSIARGAQHNLDLDILQNRVEICLFRSDMLDLEQEMRDHQILMTELAGVNSCDTLFLPIRRNIVANHTYPLDHLVAHALNNRADMLAAASEIDLSKLQVKSAKVERIPQFDLFIGYQLNQESRNIEAPHPRHTGIEVGIAFPIPIFDLNRGAIKEAESEEKRAKLRYEMAKSYVRREVTTAYNNYQHRSDKLELFRASLVKNAREALDQKREQYQAGEIHLLEVLDAQRSYDTILSSFFTAIYDRSKALVELQSAVGIWDISVAEK